jgi:hypothetical protein
MCGNGRLANRRSDAYSRFLGPEEAVKDGSRFADGMPGPLPKKEKTPSRFIERRLDVDPGICSCVIDWTLLTSRLMITCCN